jgi:hypothetical protein
MGIVDGGRGGYIFGVCINFSIGRGGIVVAVPAFWLYPHITVAPITKLIPVLVTFAAPLNAMIGAANSFPNHFIPGLHEEHHMVVPHPLGGANTLLPFPFHQWGCTP